MSVISACLGVARAPFLLLPVTLVALGAAAGASDELLRRDRVRSTVLLVCSDLLEAGS